MGGGGGGPLDPSLTIIGRFAFVLEKLSSVTSGKSRDYREAIVIEKLRRQNVFPSHEIKKNAMPAFSNFSSLKSIFKKLYFRDGLV